MASTITAQTRSFLDEAYRAANHAQGYMLAGKTSDEITSLDAAILAANEASRDEGYSEYVADLLERALTMLYASRDRLVLGQGDRGYVITRAISLLADVACYCNVRREVA